MLKHNTSMKTFSFFFFFNDTATTEIYTLSLHDALPILAHALTDDPLVAGKAGAGDVERRQESGARPTDLRGLGRRAVFIPAVLIPVADPPDDFVAPVARARGAQGEILTPGDLERILRPAGQPEHAKRVDPACLCRAGD